jgi:hypoxanthine phosphoribosyltransferase
MADLMRAIDLPVTVDFLALSPYAQEREVLHFTKDLEEDITGQRVIVVEDIVDTGISLHRLLQYLDDRSPNDVAVCALLDKRARRIADVPIRYTGFEVGDEFVVGYGLDYRQEFRNLPYVGVVRTA